jgi:hypothetical protein
VDISPFGEDISQLPVLFGRLPGVFPALERGFDELLSNDAATLLRKSVDASFARWVFESPSFLVDDERFFRVEKPDQPEERLSTRGW